jgi:hypothetical protein
MFKSLAISAIGSCINSAPALNVVFADNEICVRKYLLPWEMGVAMRVVFLAVAVFVFVALDISHNDGKNLRWLNASLKALERDLR